MFQKGDLVRLKIKKFDEVSDDFRDRSISDMIDVEMKLFNERYYWGVKDGDLGVVLDDNYGPKATHQPVYFASSKRGVINIKKCDLEKVNVRDN